MNKKIIFIIVTYNPDKQILNELIRSLQANPLIIVDNGCKSNIIHSDNLLLKMKRNLGFAAGANKGIQIALKRSAEWIVILNQDVIISKNDVRKFIHQLCISSPGIVGPVQGVLDAKRWTTILNQKTKGQTYISGSFMAIHRRVLSKVGLFYKKYFLYYEDSDLCIRAQKAGFPLSGIFLPSFRHQESLTLSPNSFEHQYYLARNHLLFVERCAPWKIKLHEFVRLPKTIVEHLIKNERGGYRGVIDYILRRFGPIH